MVDRDSASDHSSSSVVHAPLMVPLRDRPDVRLFAAARRVDLRADFLFAQFGLLRLCLCNVPTFLFGDQAGIRNHLRAFILVRTHMLRRRMFIPFVMLGIGSSGVVALRMMKLMSGEAILCTKPT
jgi:hypothetical protein